MVEDSCILSKHYSSKAGSSIAATSKYRETTQETTTLIKAQKQNTQLKTFVTNNQGSS